MKNVSFDDRTGSVLRAWEKLQKAVRTGSAGEYIGTNTILCKAGNEVTVFCKQGKQTTAFTREIDAIKNIVLDI